MMPAPDFKSPFHCAFALRSMFPFLEINSGEPHDRRDHAPWIFRFAPVRKELRGLAGRAQTQIEDLLRSHASLSQQTPVGFRQIHLARYSFLLTPFRE